MKIKDTNGIELKEGDKIELHIVGLGRGDAEIKKNDEGILCIYEPSQGYYPLDKYEANKAIEATIK